MLLSSPFMIYKLMIFNIVLSILRVLFNKISNFLNISLTVLINIWEKFFVSKLKSAKLQTNIIDCNIFVASIIDKSVCLKASAYNSGM